MDKTNINKDYFIELFVGDISIFGKTYKKCNRNTALQSLINESIFDKDLRDRIERATRLEITLWK